MSRYGCSLTCKYHSRAQKKDTVLCVPIWVQYFMRMGRIMVFSDFCEVAQKSPTHSRRNNSSGLDRLTAVKYGAANRIRTGDLILTKDVLYHLSHSSKKVSFIIIHRLRGFVKHYFIILRFPFFDILTYLF